MSPPEAVNLLAKSASRWLTAAFRPSAKHYARTSAFDRLFEFAQRVYDLASCAMIAIPWRNTFRRVDASLI
jgi:hypothetical protein